MYLLVKSMSEAITIRVPKEIRKIMKELDYVNWSEVARKAIIEVIRVERMKMACKIQDELRAKTSGNWDALEELRRWREARR